MKYLYISILIIFTHYSFSQCLNDTLDIGSDTTLCTGQSIQLNAGPSYLNYDWSTGSTNQSININTSGTYWAHTQIIDSNNIVLNGGFAYGDNFFSSSYVYGTGGTWGLLSNEGQYAISTNASLTHTNFASCNDHTSGTGNYMIVNGSSTANQHVWCQTIGVSPNTTYIFTAWFTSVVSSNPAILDFTIDGTAIGAPVSLSGTTCQWQNFYSTWTSNATQTSATICITNQNTQQSGNDFGIDDIYFAQICDFYDTIQVNYEDYPIVDLGADTSICENDTVTLNATADSNSTYLWSDNSMDSVYYADTTETVWVEVSNAHCSSYDTIQITSYTFPDIDLGTDTTICDGIGISFDISWPNSTYLWSDNTTNPQKTINSSGQYWAEVNNNNCISRDTIDINISSGPNPVLDSKTVFCSDENAKLNCGSFSQYQWSTGQTSDEIWVNYSDAGIIKVVVWDAAGCFDSTETEVIPVDYPDLQIIVSHDTICIGDELIIELNGADYYLWENGMTNNIFSIKPKSESYYNLTAGNIESGINCEIDTSVYVFAKDCNKMFVPNAFSPDGDGLNDFFIPQGEFLLEYYEFNIYDRWGNLVFHTTDINQSWDGKNIDGEIMPTGVYVYLIKIKEPFIDLSEYYGTVHLLK